MIRVLVLALAVLLTIYCLVDLSHSPASRVRALPRWLWAVAILGLPVIGPAAWLGAGRPLPGPRPPLRAPDDDDDFLRGLRRGN